MELVPPPERVTLPAGVNLVQCFVCAAMFYTQEEHDKHLKLHRKADILRAVTEHRVHHHHHHHRGGGGGGSAGLLRPSDAGYKLDAAGEPAAHELVAHAHHSHHTHPAHPAHPSHAAWMEVPAAHERPPPPLPPPPPPPLAQPPAHHLLMPEMQSLHGWTLMSGAGVSGPSSVYTDLDAGPSGSDASHLPETAPASSAAAAAASETELPAAELLCTEESLHSSCPSPGEPTVLRPAPEYHGQDFSVYSSDQPASQLPGYSVSPSRRVHLTLPAEPPEPAAPAPDAILPHDYVSFKCIHCSREFGSAEDIHLHLSVVSEASHVCQVCHEVCTSAWHLDDHMDGHSSPLPFKCGVCAREFRSSALHRQHILQHIPARIRDRVSSELPGSAGPPAEATAAAAVPPLPPPVAAGAGSVPRAAVTKKPLSCTTCGAQFALAAALHRHTMQQHRQRRRPSRRICSCDHCGRIFYSYKQLRWHAEIHGKRPHSCATCGLRFLHESWLTRHIRAQHDPTHVGPHSGDSKPCPVCNRVYMRSSIRKHIRMMHQEVKPYQCSRCGRRFAAKCNLQSHELSHLSYRDRPHKCTQCRKAYTTARDLRVHLATHEGKKYPCKVCGREFTRVNTMNLHLREHDGEKKHMCGVCGKRFARKAYLMGHVRTHTGERPHECAVCGRSFASRSNYNAHVKSHTRREPVNAEL